MLPAVAMMSQMLQLITLIVLELVEFHLTLSLAAWLEQNSVKVKSVNCHCRLLKFKS